MPGQPKTPEERHEYGKSLRDKTPLESHAEWSPGSDRRDPVELVEEQNEGRVPWLVVDLAGGGSAGLVRLLVGAYAALAVGFLFCALLTRLAPKRRYMVAVGLVFVTVVIAAALMLDDRPEAGPIPAVLLGISLVIGAFGYALRVRGFSETVSGREI